MIFNPAGPLNRSQCHSDTRAAENSNIIFILLQGRQLGSSYKVQPPFYSGCPFMDIGVPERVICIGPRESSHSQ